MRDAVRKNLIDLAYTVVMLALAAALAVSTYVRNLAWQDPLKLWQDAMEKSPAKARPVYKLGMIYVEREEYQKAFELMAKARSLDPEYFRHVLAPAIVRNSGIPPKHP